MSDASVPQREMCTTDGAGQRVLWASQVIGRDVRVEYRGRIGTRGQSRLEVHPLLFTVLASKEIRGNPLNRDATFGIEERIVQYFAVGLACWKFCDSGVRRCISE